MTGSAPASWCFSLVLLSLFQGVCAVGWSRCDPGAGAGCVCVCAAHTRTELEVWSAPGMIRQRRGAPGSQTLPFPWRTLPELQCQGLESPDQNMHLVRCGVLPLTKRCAILHVLFCSLQGCSASCSVPWAPCALWALWGGGSHTQLGLIPRVGLCRLSQDLLPKVREGWRQPNSCAVPRSLL